jgi:hypothetical protein
MRGFLDFSSVNRWLERLREKDAQEIRERQEWIAALKDRLGLVTCEDER